MELHAQPAFQTLFKSHQIYDFPSRSFQYFRLWWKAQTPQTPTCLLHGPHPASGAEKPPSGTSDAGQRSPRRYTEEDRSLPPPAHTLSHSV